MTATSPTFNPLAAATGPRIVDFQKIKSNAAAKGYETFVVDSMVERSAVLAMSRQPSLYRLDPSVVKREVGAQFMSGIESAGGFRQAYQQELRVMREVGRIVPEQRLEGLTHSANAFIDQLDKKSPSHVTIKERLIEEARAAASALRTFGMDDQIVVKRLTQFQNLVKHGVVQRAAELIADDREIGQEARARVRSAASSRPAFAQRMR